ncbi:hypothetical protein [Pontibacillus litoralis]|uniref:hypothetical protein n=1 Tax=Pontibacillus litoralis TaxID=516703 RepID=UPI0018DE7476|nr:hypothetical protein [Pontibacillus litoralis]
MNSPLPSISFKGVSILVLFLAIGLLAIQPTLSSIFNLSEEFSMFMAMGVTSTLAIGIVLTKVDDQVINRRVKVKRWLLGAVIGHALSFLLSYIL